MAEVNEVDANGTTEQTSRKRGPVSLRTVLFGVLIAGGILAAIFVLDPEFLNESEQLTAAETTETAQDGGAGRGRGGRGGGFDPAAIFAQRDADGNGFIEGDEISGRMAERIESMDGDSDGKISEEEFMSALRNRGGRRGGRDSSGPTESGEEATSDPAPDEEAEEAAP